MKKDKKNKIDEFLDNSSILFYKHGDNYEGSTINEEHEVLDSPKDLVNDSLLINCDGIIKSLDYGFYLMLSREGEHAVSYKMLLISQKGKTTSKKRKKENPVVATSGGVTLDEAFNKMNNIINNYFVEKNGTLVRGERKEYIEKVIASRIDEEYDFSNEIERGLK